MAPRDIRSIDIAMLRTFDALMRERSVSRAAARLFLSQPAVSATLNRLRGAFGDPLFTRTGHGVLPTARAQRLAPQVERLLLELSQLLEPEGGFDPAGSQRIFRLAGSDHASHWVLPPLARELAALGSGIRLFWEQAPFASTPERLRKGDIDIALMPRLKPPTEVECLPLYGDHYVAVARHGHPAFSSGLTLEGFCALPQAFFGYGTSALDDLIDSELARLGQRRLAQVAVTGFSQMVTLLAETDHAAVMPQRVARAHAAQLQNHALPFALPGYTLYIGWDRRSTDDPGLAWLRGRLVSLAAAAG
jgi:DNA-binding transcriptional LysR family regulator